MPVEHIAAHTKANRMLLAKPAAQPSLAAAPPRRSPHMCRRRCAPAARAALVDPSAPSKRLVVAPQKLDPHMLEDMRKAEAVGPRGALLVGLGADDCAAVQAWFDAMEPGLVASCCPPALLAGGTLGQAVGEGAALPRRPAEQQPADAPPVVFFSGMSGEEQVALIEAWAEHTGLQAPAFAAVTAGTLGKPLSKLVADIVRAQAQAPPPGFDPGQGGELRAQAASGAAGEAAAAAGGEAALRGKLQDYVMLNDGGGAEAAPMSLEQLKEQIQEKMRRKKAEQAAAERQARKAASRDQTDAMVEALRGGRKGKQGKQGKGRQQAAGGGRGFGGQ